MRHVDGSGQFQQSALNILAKWMAGAVPPLVKGRLGGDCTHERIDYQSNICFSYTELT